MDYYANKGAFAKNCINKARPKMRCNGKCQMMKALLAEHKKEQEGIENKLKLKIDLLAPEQIFSSDIFFNLTLKKNFPKLVPPTLIGILLSIKHPPQLFV